MCIFQNNHGTIVSKYVFYIKMKNINKNNDPFFILNTFFRKVLSSEQNIK